MNGERETLGTAVYNLDDDTLRWSPGARLDADEYARTRAAGFKWWRSSEAWVARWTTRREDFLLEFVEEIGHEADPDDPDARITRFAGRAAAAEGRSDERARAAMQGLPPMGEPIKVGHHSEGRHRRAIERSDQNMRRAVEEGRKAEYWRGRAAGAERRARQKSDPGVIRRRIEKLEAERRVIQRSLADLEARPPTPETQASWDRSVTHWRRWAEHLDLRLEFERARLASLNPEPFAPVTAYKKGDVVDTKRYGRCEVVRVGPKNVKVRQITGPTKGWEWAVPPHELRPVPPEEPSTSG
ncbi:DUF3560 domain-containing protein [Deinococcus sp. MIMF12]|uniref:DUF3560 domain-containing protein n=1 Tax=Deinococcus rhizophilus TaxID=3049544 RepID=A0ABT7JBV9_9DEIO|nr:DUF3560 domain-containing protein [Deinococcus rhizophilus]MDL2342538.1 DUF3560 domain-containing protein [Deinococcus rhizophilus]